MEFIASEDSIVEDVAFWGLLEYIKPRYAQPSRCHCHHGVCLYPKCTCDHTHSRASGSGHPYHQFYLKLKSPQSWDASPESMLSLTVKWIGEGGLTNAVLHSQESPVQVQLGTETKRLQQDVATRGNSMVHIQD